MPVCINTYEVTNSNNICGGVSWKTYTKEIIEYSKYTLGQIVPLMFLFLGANPQNTVTMCRKSNLQYRFCNRSSSCYQIIIML